MTAAAFLNSPKFLEIAGQDAIALLAKTHKTTARKIKQDLPTSTRLQQQLADLIQSAAEECARRFA